MFTLFVMDTTERIRKGISQNSEFVFLRSYRFKTSENINEYDMESTVRLHDFIENGCILLLFDDSGFNLDWHVHHNNCILDYSSDLKWTIGLPRAQIAPCVLIVTRQNLNCWLLKTIILVVFNLLDVIPLIKVYTSVNKQF